MCAPQRPKCLWRPKEGMEYPRSGVPDNCKPPHKGAENQIQVLRKSTKYS